MAGRARAEGNLEVSWAFLGSVGAEGPLEDVAGRAGWWPPRELVLRRSCVAGGATNGSVGWGGGPWWQWCVQVGRWWLKTGSSPWRQPWRLGGRPDAREEERRAGFKGGEWERGVVPSSRRIPRPLMSWYGGRALACACGRADADGPAVTAVLAREGGSAWQGGASGGGQCSDWRSRARLSMRTAAYSGAAHAGT
jgi:hypothetical protein